MRGKRYPGRARVPGRLASVDRCPTKRAGPCRQGDSADIAGGLLPGGRPLPAATPAQLSRTAARGGVAVIGWLLSVAALLTQGCASGRAERSPPENKAAAGPAQTQTWAVLAMHDLRELEALKSELEPYWWLFVENLSWEDARYIGAEEFRAGAIAADRAAPRIGRLLWRLWTLCGRSPFSDFCDTQVGVLESLPKHISGYRAYLQRWGLLPADAVQRRGLAEAVELLGTRYWSSAECYVRDRVYGRSKGNVELGQHFFADGVASSTGDRAVERERARAWFDANIGLMVWDDKAQRFRIADGALPIGPDVGQIFLEGALGVSR